MSGKDFKENIQGETMRRKPAAGKSLSTKNKPLPVKEDLKAAVQGPDRPGGLGLGLPGAVETGEGFADL